MGWRISYAAPAPKRRLVVPGAVEPTCQNHAPLRFTFIIYARIIKFEQAHLSTRPWCWMYFEIFTGSSPERVPATPILVSMYLVKASRRRFCSRRAGRLEKHA